MRGDSVGASGRAAVVVTLDFPSPDVAEFLGTLGCDAVALDIEHATPTAADLSNLVRACAVGGVDLVGRTQCRQEPVLMCLDAGLTVLELTQVTSAADVDQVVGWAGFAPDGQRGIGRARANSFGHHPGGYPAFVDSLRRDGIDLIVHVETVEAVAAVKQLAAHPWVKALVVGAHDLAASAGHPGDPSHPEVRQLIEAAVAEIGAGEAALGLSAGSRADALSAVEQGAGVLLVSQARLMSHALSSVLKGAAEVTR
ncbi:aldolase/citrate lyase family protein [Streptomyces sp. NPDC004629]|uniref:aldolase/citrate lyase family protein n=1 Tax=Streptomyces sp. NPDC004629 TaxID=3364705 RepID=UPI0036768A2B